MVEAGEEVAMDQFADALVLGFAGGGLFMVVALGADVVVDDEIVHEMMGMMLRSGDVKHRHRDTIVATDAVHLTGTLLVEMLAGDKSEEFGFVTDQTEDMLGAQALLSVEIEFAVVVVVVAKGEIAAGGAEDVAVEVLFGNRFECVLRAEPVVKVDKDDDVLIADNGCRREDGAALIDYGIGHSRRGDDIVPVLQLILLNLIINDIQSAVRLRKIEQAV